MDLCYNCLNASGERATDKAKQVQDKTNQMLWGIDCAKSEVWKSEAGH